MTVSLTWKGPVGPGRIPDDPLIFENLCAAGVYVRIKTYEGGRYVAYAGQSVSLLARFDQHMSAMLSLASPLRDRSGEVIFTGDAGARMDAYNDLERVSVIAAADVSRVRFWYALCDDYFHTEHLNLVEGLLQRRLTLRLSDIENAVAAPGATPDDAPDRWENDFSGLDPSHRDVLADLLGAEPMTPGLLTGHAA
ncbi:MAG: hypothetical protein VYB45_08085 [Pseudomonadota bacterium]|nr:hypothetical protein [Pseudomonadota bacterium]|tara:strand:+ start:657 stop:1241 length:585 start_codon:yes stop_codon:yes gene_type:complete